MNLLPCVMLSHQPLICKYKYIIYNKHFELMISIINQTVINSENK